MKYGIKSTKEIESVLLYGDKNKRKKKLISIVIPTYKREKLLKEALESAINQLNFNDYEIVIVDNDDNFGNFEIKKMIESYQKDNIYYYKNKKNLGVTGNWNRCIELANSEWIVMLHDDDWLKKDALEKIKSFISKYKEVKIINFKPDVYDGINNKYYESQGKIKVEKILYKRLFVGQQVMAPIALTFSKKKALEIGGFREEFYPSLDYEFWFRFLEKNEGINISNDAIAYYRLLENISLRKETQQGCLEKDYKITQLYNKKSHLIGKIGFYRQIYKICYKSLCFDSISEKEEFIKKLKIRKKDEILAYLVMKLQIFGVVRSYLKLKTYFLSLKYN